MKYQILLMFLLFGATSCSEASDEQIAGDIISAYNTAHYDVAFKTLAEHSRPGSPKALDFWAAKIYAVHAYWTKDKAFAGKAITYLNAMEADPNLRRGAKIYFNYLYALSYDVLGRNKDAHDVFAKNCAIDASIKHYRCEMIGQITGGSVENLDYEIDYAISNSGLKYGFDDPMFPVIQIASLVFRDYRAGHALKLKYINDGKLSQNLSNLYCDSVAKNLSLNPAIKLFPDDISTCKRFWGPSP